MEEILEDQLALAEILSNFRTVMLKAPREKRTTSWFKTQLEQLESLWSDFLKAHKKLIRWSEKDKEQRPYFQDDMFAAGQNQYIAVKTEILDVLSPGRRQTSIQADSQYAGVSFETPQYKTPLPSMQLPQFSGNQLEWETFKGMFLALVHDVPTFPPILKLQYLIRSLTGEAANRLKNVQIVGENYESSWQAIQARKSVEEVRRLVDLVRESKQALDNLNVEPARMSELWLIHHTIHKLDQSTRLDWERHADELTSFPSYDELISFLERYIRVLDAASTTSAGPQPSTSSENSAVKSAKSAPSKYKQVSAHATSTQVARKPTARTCALCRGTHVLYSCQKFLSLPQSQRYEVCRREKLCLNCLSGSHFARDCQSEKRCLVCQAKHHTKLHADTRTQQESTDTSNERAGTGAPIDGNEDPPASVYFAGQDMSRRRSDDQLILLATARIVLLDSFGNELQVRALIDPCSQRSFVTERAMKALCVKMDKVSVNIKVMGGSHASTARKEARVTIKSKMMPEFTTSVVALVMSELTGLMPRIQLQITRWSHLKGVQLADPAFHRPDRVDCVIGADMYTSILLDGLKKGPEGTPVAQRTVFGWILTGEGGDESTSRPQEVTAFHTIAEPTLNQLLEKFWQIEDIAQTKHWTTEEQFCEDYFVKTTSRNSEGRFVVRLPFAAKTRFECSRDIALSCLFRMERRIMKSPRLSLSYNNFMREYLQLKHMELVPPTQISAPSFYLPHHGVFKSENSDKIRVVFNASQKAANRVSLNETLLTGPKLQKDVTSVITRWRLFRFVFVTNIVKMFRQILVHPEDTDYQRILWRSTKSQPVQDYRALTVTVAVHLMYWLQVATYEAREPAFARIQ
ncbi:uncharacterized protein LOC106654050 [Trichogramma pretiosum]|uniref:uncharacterized protein LOC106654050 n=1 Tax=Trichogramma pretiosum TaxID=7493 RepID=UPI000C71AD5B|nr:uncharacterized protein LOC106654050 [Trichogramma pretiosum]